jgi:hypothetical protein
MKEWLWLFVDQAVAIVIAIPLILWIRPTTSAGLVLLILLTIAGYNALTQLFKFIYRHFIRPQ